MGGGIDVVDPVDGVCVIDNFCIGLVQENEGVSEDAGVEVSEFLLDHWCPSRILGLQIRMSRVRSVMAAAIASRSWRRSDVREPEQGLPGNMGQTGIRLKGGPRKNDLVSGFLGTRISCVMIETLPAATCTESFVTTNLSANTDLSFAAVASGYR